MAGAKGYRSYRGRGSKLKILLAVLLCLVILAAAVVILLQEHVVFDSNGRLRLEIPWETEQEEEDPGELDLVIQEPEGPPEMQALLIQEAPLTGAAWENAQTQGMKTYAVTVKDSSGKVYFDSKTAFHDTVETAGDTAAALEDLNRKGDSIARLSCLLDPIAAKADVEGMGLKNTGGYIFYDGNNLNWLDPSNKGTQEYLSGLAVECAAMGFDEILMTDFGFPTEGKLDKIAYPEAGTQASLRAFLTAMRTALDAAGYTDVLLSVELPSEAISTGEAETAGLVLAEIAPQVDRIYAVTTEDQMEALAQAVTDAGSTFVPELSAVPASGGSYLLTGTD